MEKRGRQIFSKIVRASKLTRQRTLEINNVHLDRSRCWQHLQEATKKTFSFMVSWQKQIKLHFNFSSELGSNINFRRFLLIVDAKAYKTRYRKIKTIICHFWRYCKDLTFAHPLFTAPCSRMNSPVNQTNRFLMLSSLILLRSLRVNILKQLFTSGSVNIVE